MWTLSTHRKFHSCRWTIRRSTCAKSDLQEVYRGRRLRRVALASPVTSASYRDSIAHGETGLIFNGIPDEFHRHFLRLTASPRSLALAA